MKKKVLVIRTASTFVSTSWIYMCHLSAGTSIVVSSLDKDKYDVDYFDYDAYLKKNYRYAENYFGVKLDNDSKFVLDRKVLKLFESFEDIGKYDYILLSMYLYGTESVPLYEFNNTFVDYLKLKNPRATMVGGGMASYFDNPASKRLCLEIMDKLDGFTRNRVMPSNLDKYLENLSVEPEGWNVRSLNTLCPEPYNKKDLEYTYEEIFKYSYCILPEWAPKDRIVKQCEVLFTDGCVGQCAFCASGKRPFNSMSFNDIESILKQRVEQGYNIFFFLNNTLNPSIKYLEKFCNLIVKNNLNIRWSDSLRFHGMGPDEYKMIFEAGGRIMSYGCEVIDDDMLKYVNKGITVDDILKGLQWSHEAGIWNQLNFVIGMPHEKAEPVVQLIEFIRENSEYIDTLYTNEFKMNEPSLFYQESDKYGVRIRDDSVGHVEKLDGVYYDEIDGMKWNEIKKLKQFKFDLVTREAQKIDYSLPKKPKMVGFPIQCLIMALYDIFDDDKEKVRRHLSDGT